MTNTTEGLILPKVQNVSSKYGAGAVLLAFLGIAFTALAVDYTWMIYRHYKMVSHLFRNIQPAAQTPSDRHLATWSFSSTFNRKHPSSPREQTLDLL